MSKESMNQKRHPDPEYPHRILPGARMTEEEKHAAWDEEATGMVYDRQIRLHLPLYGAQSFEELETGSVEDFEQKRKNRLNIYFMLILGNIVSNPDIDAEEIGIRLHNTIAEYARKLNALDSGIAPADEEDAVEAIIPKESKVKSPIKRENGIDYSARDYAYAPDPATPSTWKLRLTETPGKVSVTQLARATAALSPSGFRGQKVEIPTSAMSAVKRRILAEYRMLKVPEGNVPGTVKATKTGGQFTLWKDKSSGRYRWMAVYSNNFMDRDSPPEIISEKSHKTFVQMVDEGVVDYPELWHWHIPGTAWGKADMLDYVDGFALAVGYIYPGHEKEAVALAGRKDLGVSHGMPFATLLYDPTDPGVIDFHVTREISVLPHHAVANPLTDFVVLDDTGGINMPITTKKRDWLINDLGLEPEFVKSLERNLKEMNDLAHTVGLASKEADEEEYDEEEYEAEDESEGYDAEDESDEEYDEEEDEDVEYEDDEDEDVSKSLRWPRGRDEPEAVEKRRGGLWTGPRGRDEATKRTPKSRDTAAKRTPKSRDTGYLWTGRSSSRKEADEMDEKGRPQSGSSGSGRKKPSSFAPRGRNKPSSFAPKTRDEASKRTPKSRDTGYLWTGGKRGKKKDDGSDDYVTRTEVAETLAELIQSIVDTQEALVTMGAVLKELRQTDSERIANLKEQTPTASLREVIARQVAIGQEAARIDGRTQLAKEGPQERKEEAVAYTPSGFVNGLMNVSLHGPAQQAQ